MSRILAFLKKLFRRHRPVPIAPAPGPAPGAGGPLPPFGAGVAAPPPLSPEEMLLLLEMPPVGIIRQQQLVSASELGTIPQSSELTKLGPTGKLIVRTEAVFLDDFGQRGEPGQLAGRCQGCGRVGFQLKACEACGGKFCLGCGGTYQDGEAISFLCAPHLDAARRNQDLW